MRKINNVFTFLCLCSTCPLVGITFNLSSCASQNKPSKVDLFIVENGVLKGFKQSITMDDIKSQLENNVLSLPDNIISIADHAFYKDNKSTIPDGVKEINFSQAATLTTIGEDAFRESPISTLVIPTHIKNINKNAFALSKISSINFLSDNNVENSLSLHESAFRKCDLLKNINFGFRNYNVDEKAFADLANLTNIDFSSFVAPPDWNADNIFLNSGATDSLLTIKNDLHILEWEAFKSKLQLSQNTKILCATKIYDFELNNDVYILNGFNKQTSKEQIVAHLNNTLTIPNFINKINDQAFVTTDGATTIPQEIQFLNLQNNFNLHSIGTTAFQDSPFKEITLSNSLTSIEHRAFYKSSVTTLKFIDKTSTKNGISLAPQSFESCENLQSIKLTNSNKQIGTLAFMSLPNLSILDLTALNSNFNFTDNWSTNIFQNNEHNSCKILVRSDFESKHFWNNYFNQTELEFSTDSWSFLPQEKLFNIDELNYLTGFNENLSTTELEFIFDNEPLVIPKNVVKICANAFYKDNETTIPRAVKELKFEGESQCHTIESCAFTKSPFIKIEIPNSVKLIQTNSFNDMPNLNEINLSEINFDSTFLWESNSFGAPVKPQGNIFLKNNSVNNHEFANYYFAKKNQFNISDDQWQISPIYLTINELFKFSTEYKPTGESDLYIDGFSTYFLSVNENLQYKFLEKLFISHDSIIIPSFVNVVRKEAFFCSSDQAKDIKLPKYIRVIKFQQQSKCHTIQTQAFGYYQNPTSTSERSNFYIDTIEIPPSTQNIEENAFDWLSQLRTINLHGITKIPDSWLSVLTFISHFDSGCVWYNTSITELEIKNFINSSKHEPTHPNPFNFASDAWIITKQ